MLKIGIIVLISMWTASSVTGETCTHYNGYDNYEIISCPRSYDSYDEYYCCVSGSSQYCCDYDDVNGVTYVNVPGIIGGVISFLLVFGLIIAFSICCCVASCPLYQRRHRGRVMAGGRTSIVVSQQTNRMHQPPPVAGMAYPLHPQYGMSTTYTSNYGNNRQQPPYGMGYSTLPGVVYSGVNPQQQQPPHMAYPPPPPNYNQVVGTQSQTVAVATNETANPVHPPV